MTKRVMLMSAALVILLPGIGSCEDRAVQVPARVWEAAMSSCEKSRECSPAHFNDLFSSLEDCADSTTKHFPWGRYTEECIESHIATLECEAAEPCYAEPHSCELPNQLLSYNCWRFNTLLYGQNCGLDATDMEECHERCYAVGGIRVYALCSQMTPDYCNCGQEICQEGEYCCYCQDDW